MPLIRGQPQKSPSRIGLKEHNSHLNKKITLSNFFIAPDLNIKHVSVKTFLVNGGIDNSAASTIVVFFIGNNSCHILTTIIVLFNFWLNKPWKHKIKVGNMFKVNNKNVIEVINFKRSSHLSVPIADFENVIVFWPDALQKFL